MTIRVRVAGLGDVGPITVWGQTQLESTAQGTPSEGTIAIRDLGFSPIDFVAGSRVEVDLGPDTRNIWGGYLMRSSRSAWFPVDDPDKKHRLWILHLLDNNVLFSKRVVAKLTDPGHVEGPIYKTTAYDDDVIATLVSEWLDLSTDGIDTSSLVNRVASIYYGQPTYPWNAGFTWQEAMDVISQLPAAVYALDPDWNLIYGDVDDANVDFILHNNPRGGSGRHGYRESTIWNDGSRLANDFLAWGFGKGSAQGVFSRETNDASIEAHGLWQDAFTAYDIWHQSTINKVTDSAVNGSPTSHRGRKDDRVAVEVVTMEHGLRVADRVRYVNTIYDFDDVLPVRKITIKPVTADVARYELVLSHEIDRWGFQDPSPPWSIPRHPIIDVPGDGGGDIGGGTDGGCDCGITDTFTREIAANPDSWGMSDMGATWRRHSFGDEGTFSVDGSAGTIGPGLGTQRLDLPAEAAPDKDIYVDVKFTGAAGATDGQDIWDIWYGGGYNSAGEVVFDYYPAGSTGTPFGILPSIPVFGFWFGYENDTDLFEEVFSRELAEDTWYTFHINLDHTHKVTSVRIWTQGDPEPTSWDAVIDFSASTGIWDPLQFGFNENILGVSAGVDGQTLTIDNLDVSGNTRCDATQFDNFERTVTNGWGNATPSGTPWLVGTADGVSDPTALASAFSVHDGYGEFLFASTPSDDGVIRIEGIPTTPIEMLVKFSANGTDGDANPQFYVSAYDTNVWYYHGIDVGMFSGSSYISPVSYGTNQPGDVDSLDLPDMTDWNTIWMLRMSVEGGRVMGKVWRSTETEPVDWQVMAGQTDYAFPTDHGEINNFYLFFPNIDSDIRIYDLEFNYEGKPCYYDCGGITDSFDRADTVDGLGTSDSGQPWDNGGFINGGTAEAPAGLSVSPTSAPPVLSVSSPVPFSTSIIRTEPADPDIDGSGPAYSGRIVLYMDDDGTIALSWREEPTWVLTLIRLDVVGEGGGGADETLYADTFDVTFPFTLEVCYADGVAMASIDGHNLSFDYAANGVTLPNGLVGYQLGWID